MKLRIAALVLALGLLVAGVVAVLTSGNGEEEVVVPTGPSPEEREEMTPQERARAHMDDVPEGEHQGRLITIDETTATFRLVQVLSGAEALEAARADGQFLEDDRLPNDVYVRDTFETVTLPVADGLGIRIQSCANGCQEVDTPLSALLAGEAVPHGGDDPVFVFAVRGGEVVSMAEVYLP